MSIDTKAEVTTKDRTTRVTIQTPHDSGPSVTINREMAGFDVNKKVLFTTPVAAEVHRAFADVQAETVVVGGVTVSAGLMAMAIAAFADKWRQEDLDLAAKAQPPA